MDEKVSVIVPVFNTKKFLKKCIHSIFNQSYKNIEIIIINDGSTDGSKELCDSFKKKKNVKVIHKKNGGLSDARNVGIENSTGKYLYFVDSDDWIPLNSIELLVNSIKTTDSQIACGKIKIVNNYNIDSTIYSSSNICIDVYNNIDALEKMLYMHEVTNSANAKLYDISLFKEIKFPYGKLFEDLGTTYKLFLKSKKICIIDEIVYFYYQNSNSIMHYKYSNRRLDALNFAIVQHDYITKNFNYISNSSRYRLFYECLSILNDMPYKCSDKKYIKSIISENRCTVLFDKKLYFKQRLLCFISLFGQFVIKFVFKVKNSLRLLKSF